MNIIRDYLLKHFGTIIESIIITMIGSVLFAILKNCIKYINKKISPKSLPKPGENAVYLNNLQNVLYDKCIGRKADLDKVYDEIINKKNASVKKNIFITGEEGIGKTLFCQTLFKYSLKYSPLYLGWVDCNGVQSIFDIIKTTFQNSQFYGKNKEMLLKEFNKLEKPCVLFIDKIDQNTPMDDLEELSSCENVILVMSGGLKMIRFADKSIMLKPLHNKYIYKIFENEINERIELMDYKNRNSVKIIIDEYVRGNPYLAIALAKARCIYKGSWQNMLEYLRNREYMDENYIKSVLKQLYKINLLSFDEREVLSKLSTLSFLDYVDVIFKWMDISSKSIKRLCNTYWLWHQDYILYSMNKFRHDVIFKTLTIEYNLINAIHTVYNSLINMQEYNYNEFKLISPYFEDILKKIKGNAPYILDEEIFSRFSWEIASKYNINKYDKRSLEWIELCKPQSTEMAYKKAYLEFRIKGHFVNSLFSAAEVEQIYFSALHIAGNMQDSNRKKMYLFQEYCMFLNSINESKKVILQCKEFFSKYELDLSDQNVCLIYYRYLYAANLLGDKESLDFLVNDTTIRDLYLNEEKWVSIAWCFGELAELFKKWGNVERSEKYMRHMVVLLNKHRGFFHIEIKTFLKISEEEFCEYIHSCVELRESLEDALYNEDPEAQYIEGRYCEKHGDLKTAFELYEKAAAKDSLRGMCSLALLYYRGQAETQDLKKAYKYWHYCCDRGHRGSYYWMGILFLDKSYENYNKDYALWYLKKAANLGSKRAQQKLLEV